jgi:hypothetical protein
MKVEQIPRTALDEKFRQVCTKLIDGASESVYVIAGEMGSLYFPDMHTATAKAHDKGAEVYAYATEKTPAHLRNFALSIGVKLYIGSKPLKEHYLVIDGKHFVKSINKPIDRETILGEREGEVHYDDPEGAKDIIRMFEELCSNGKLVTSLDKKADPLYQFLYGK